jgi:hypothetical protein
MPFFRLVWVASTSNPKIDVQATNLTNHEITNRFLQSPLPIASLWCLSNQADSPQLRDKMDIRILRPSDIPHVQQTNITNLPENYFCKYYMYHALTWPQLSYVAVDVSFALIVSFFGREWYSANTKSLAALYQATGSEIYFAANSWSAKLRRL